MKKSLLLASVFSLFGMAASAGIVPFGGFDGSVNYTVEPVVSGFSVADNGTVMGLGAVVPSGNIPAGVDEIIMEGAQGPVEIFTIDGRLVRVSTNGELDTDNLPAGIYVVRSGNSVSKIIK